MKKLNATSSMAIVAIIMLLIIGYFCGHRLDGLSAARANSFVPKDAKLIDQVDYDWGGVYIFDSSEKPITAVSIKTLGILWTSRFSVYYFHNDDPIRTIGGVTFSDEREKATVFSILVEDPDVAYIEVGPEGNRYKKYVTLGEPITFSWDVPIQWNKLSPQAYNEHNQLIYEYRYANTKYFIVEDLRWYPLNID